ncbi:NAD(P)-dependent oxidoreductase [Mesonia sp. K4-1]|uniref:NAD-dependent epimerase/dehydratase family protein n=1 Tax=Mesonia sp. K4-1 TaxID=2602760 RepID=UPI0011CB27F7|nr:NAD-dependent epimerase/dehydratase family protein [Mesonia sp. K4-1]TXK76989.1 NAD-dependent epimerase/dehydratase family protein [Mesonia sp. K4-1]
MKILVTGIAGFIGSHLAERLHKMGHEVIGLDNFSSYYDVNLKRENAHTLKALGVQTIERDLRVEHLVMALPVDLDYIFHCAAQPGIASSSTFEDYLSNNVITTHNLADFASQYLDLKLFVNIGTSSIYGIDVYCDEEQMAKPISNYGVTKLAAEQIVMSQSRLGNFPACSLRLYSVYGSRERPDKMFSQLIDCALNERSFPLFEGSLEHKRSFTHIRDIIDGIVSVMGKERQADGQVINLGTNKEYTTAQGIKAVEKLLDTEIKIIMKPARSGDQLRTKAVIDKAQRLLTYKPNVTLEEGVQEQIDWFKSKNAQN